MAKVKFIRNGLLPLRKLKICINDNAFFLKGNECKELDLPHGTYCFIMKMDWWQSTDKIEINSEDNTIRIEHYLPDMFYLIGITVSTILAVLIFLSKINVLYFSIWLSMFFLPQIYLYLTKKKNYFTFRKQDSTHKCNLD